MNHLAESDRIERLVGLCKLWGAVKVFHPYLAYREDIDWDAALVAVIPKVNTASDAAGYAAAVGELLAALDDPVTRVVESETAGTPPPPHERQPSYKFAPDDILMVTIHDYRDLSDFVGAIGKMQEIQVEIPKARGVLFDLRAAGPVSPDLGDLHLVFRMSEIAAVLSTTPLVTAGERTRMHIGLAPQMHGWGFAYTSAFEVMDGRRILPAPEARDLPVVFLINTWSQLPPEALALQIAGKAAIVAEGGASDAPLGVRTHPVPLSDGVTAQIRLSEIINQDGSGGFLPDRLIEPAQHPGEDDPALHAALELLKDFRLGETRRAPLPAHAAPVPENPYAEIAYPTLEYRLLAAFRIWTAINYFFPYKDLIEEDWNDVLRDFIPRMAQAGNALEYHLAVAEMVTHIHDSHGGIFSPILQEQLPHQFGPAVPPVGLQIIEEVPVITAIFDPEIARAAGVRHGDVVLKIDGDDAMERINECAKTRPASTPQSGMHRAALNSLSGPEDSLIRLTLRDREQRVKDVHLPRKETYGSWGGGSVNQRGGEVVRLLTDDLGYADLDRLEASQVDEMFEKFRDTKAIIFDMRGFPEFPIIFTITSRLTEENTNGVDAAMFQRPLVMAPEYASQDIASQSNWYTLMQPIPPTQKWRYKGKTVMLIDERAISRPEHAGLFFEAANGTKFIGSHSSGTNGDITNICLPGGIIVIFTGQAVSHADGRQLQRIGLVPDLEVRPTIEGIQNGSDEVLEAAIAYLQRQIEADTRRD